SHERRPEGRPEPRPTQHALDHTTVSFVKIVEDDPGDDKDVETSGDDIAHLIAPARMPWTNHRWAMVKITITGTVTIAKPAKNCGQLTEYCSKNPSIPTGIV